VEGIITLGIVISLLFLVIRFMPMPKSEAAILAQVAEQAQQIQAQEKKINEQAILIRALEKKQRELLEEIAILNRNYRLQVEQNAQLRQELAELRKTLGMNPHSLMILGIWPFPETELNTRVEEIAIYNAGFEYRSLRKEEATKERIVEELDRHPYFLLEIGSHGGNDGDYIHLYDDIARPGWWRELVQRYPSLKAILLLACQSDRTGDVLIQAGVPVVISVQRNIPDAHVGIFVRNFYRRLSVNRRTYQDLNDAFEYARHILPEKSAQMIRFRSTVELYEPLQPD